MDNLLNLEHRILTIDEEVELTTKYAETQDEKILEKLVLMNMRFIHNIAVQKHNLNKHIPFNDIMSAGVYGMIKAIKKFDVTKGFKLISYGVWWIRQSINTTIDEYSDIRLGVKPKANVSKIRKFSIKFENENYRKPSISEICEEFDLNETEVLRNEEYSNIRMVSYHTPIGDGELTLLDGLSNDSYDNFERQSDLNDDIQSILDRISDGRHSHIIEHSFGINGKEKMTDKELGIYWGISSSRIDQIKKTTILKLRKKEGIEDNNKSIKKEIKKTKHRTDEEINAIIEKFSTKNKKIVKEKVIEEKVIEEKVIEEKVIEEKPKKLINRILSKFFKR